MMKYLSNEMKYSILWCILLCVSLVNGQSKNTIDRTKLQKTLSVTDQEKIKNHLRELATANQLIDSATIYNKIALIHLTSQYYIDIPQYDSILYYANKATNLLEDKRSKEEINQYLFSLRIAGSTYRSLGHTSKALTYFNTVLSVTDTIADPSYFYNLRQASTTFIASFYASQKKYELAINTYNSLFDYVTEKEIDTTLISSIVYLRYARFHRKLHKIAIALKYAHKAKEVAARNQMSFRVAMAYLELAHIKLVSDFVDEAQFFAEKAFELLHNDSAYKGLLSEYYHIQSIIAQRNSNTLEHVSNAEKAFELLNKTEVSSKHVELGYLLYEAYKESGEYEKANAVLEQTYTIEKKLSNDDEIKKSALAEIQRKERTMKRVEAKSKTMNHVIVFIVVLFLIAVASVFFIYNDRKKKIQLASEIAKQHKKLEQLAEAKSQFFSNITHELQTPLTLISGPLEQALNENPENLDKSTKSKLQMAMKNTSSLKRLVNDILDLSKLRSKKLALRKKNVHLDTFLNTITRKFVPLMKQKKLDFQCCFKELENVYAIVDTKKLEKILSNLLSNAIKYTPNNGTISVSGTLTKKEWLTIFVKDTGVGISDADLPHVFDRYFQSKDTSKPLEGGYGIGLSLVKELVDLMKGEIHVQSEVNQGSEFIVSIPLKGLTKKKNAHYINAQEATIESSTDHFTRNIKNIDKTIKQHTVLIVEDHPEMQQFIASILQNNYQLVIVNNGKEALEKLQTTAIDLIVSDVMMPTMDGFTLLETLKKSEVYREIPIIILTALSAIKHKLNALTIGVDDYLTKPFIASELLARTHNLLHRYQRRKKYIQEEATVNSEEKLLETTTQNSVHVHPSEDLTKSDHELIRKVAEIIEENLENPDFQLNDLTKEIHMSQRQLRRKIKLITGLSPKKFQREIQLLKARTLIEDGEYTNVKAVAMSVGIQNTTRFSKYYMKRFGKHPASYFSS